MNHPFVFFLAPYSDLDWNDFTYPPLTLRKSDPATEDSLQAGAYLGDEFIILQAIYYPNPEDTADLRKAVDEFNTDPTTNWLKLLKRTAELELGRKIAMRNRLNEIIEKYQGLEKLWSDELEGKAD